MGAAVEDVHHRNGESVGVLTAEIAIERNVEIVCRGTRAGDGGGKNGVGAQLGLVVRAVSGNHRLVECIDIVGIHTGKRLVDDRIGVVDCLGHALAAKALLVAVAKLKCLKFAGGCAAGGCAGAGDAAAEQDIGLNGGITAGVDDFACDDLFDLGRIHSLISFF